MVDIIAAHCKEYGVNAGHSAISLASAPGRLHYLGENGLVGKRFIASSCIDKAFTVAVSFRTDGMFRFYSADNEERKRATFANLRPRREDRWANYIKAAFFTFFEQPDPEEPPPDIGGLSFTVSSGVPKHKCFGSHSALELASALAMRPFFAPDMTDDELVIKLAQSHKDFFERETDNVDFFIMMRAEVDKWTITMEEDMQDGISCARNIAAPFNGYKTYIFDSRVPLGDTIADAEKRAAQLEAGLQALIKKRAGTTFLSPDAAETLEGEKEINEETRRRCLYTVQEAQRIFALEEALKTQNTAQISKIFQTSHVGLRDMFEITCPEVDWLVRRAEETPGTAASRMLGVGFGSSVFAIMNGEADKSYKEKLEDYERIFGFHPHKFEVASGGCAKFLGLF